MKKKLKSIFIKLLLLCASVLLFLIAGEIFCRLFFDEKISFGMSGQDILRNNEYGVDYEKEQLYINKENGLYYKLSSGLLFSDLYKYFDTKTIQLEKLKNKFRIAVIGDSFSTGAWYCCENKGCGYAQQLSAMLNNKNEIKIEGIDGFEVLPFAAPGLNTYQELFLLKEAVMQYEPDLVVLQFTDNDIEPMRSPLGASLIMSSQPDSHEADLMVVKDRLIPEVPYFGKKINYFLLKHSAFFRFIAYKSSLALDPFFISQETVELAFDSVKNMAGILKNKEVPFVVINFTPTTLAQDYCGYTDNLEGKKLHEQLNELTVGLGASFYNMCDYVADIHAIKAECENEKNAHHYNREGHRLAAEALKSAVLKIIEK
ncbi:MAG TPA: SGNH/GDSL hydrolase family protein [Candidatus Portnoybacteria bacterium]|nr:SGNH/GDSL hydrolase family protein [Candidatus Portnoybacteria bacterium]